jgi:RimJ/RimL family protein N-acetyltransferase
LEITIALEKARVLSAFFRAYFQFSKKSIFYGGPPLETPLTQQAPTNALPSGHAFTIRSALPGDIPRLSEYEREISVISFGDEAVTDLEHHAKRLRKSMEQDGGGMWVLAENDNLLRGWLWMDTRVNSLTQETYVNFRSFYIEEPARGANHAERLLRHGMEWCRQKNARHIVGKVHANNAAMRALYRKAGFTATHITMEYREDQPND